MAISTDPIALIAPVMAPTIAEMIVFIQDATAPILI
jgi:hypothetical protein